MYLNEKRKENFKFSLMQTKLDELFNNREILINFLNNNSKVNSKDKVINYYHTQFIFIYYSFLTN